MERQVENRGQEAAASGQSDEGEIRDAELANAVELYRKAAWEGHCPSLLRLGEMSRRRGNSTREVRKRALLVLLEFSSRSNWMCTAAALVALGDILRVGTHILDFDMTKTVRIFERQVVKYERGLNFYEEWFRLGGARGLARVLMNEKLEGAIRRRAREFLEKMRCNAAMECFAAVLVKGSSVVETVMSGQETCTAS